MIRVSLAEAKAASLKILLHAMTRMDDFLRTFPVVSNIIILISQAESPGHRESWILLGRTIQPSAPTPKVQTPASL